MEILTMFGCIAVGIFIIGAILAFTKKSAFIVKAYRRSKEGNQCPVRGEFFAKTVPSSQTRIRTH